MKAGASLRGRLCLALIPLLAVIVLLVAIEAHLEMESRLYRQIDRELRIQGQAVTTVLSSRLIAEITPTVLDALLGNDGTQDRIYVWVHLVDGRTSVTNAPTLALPNDRPEGRDTWTTTLQGIEYRGIHYQPSPSDGRRGVTLARPSRHLHA